LMHKFPVIYIFLHKLSYSCIVCVHRLVTRHLARLHSTDIAAAAAEFGDNVHVDTEPSLFKSLCNRLEHSAFYSTDLNIQAR